MLLSFEHGMVTSHSNPSVELYLLPLSCRSSSAHDVTCCSSGDREKNQKREACLAGQFLAWEITTTVGVADLEGENASKETTLRRAYL